MFNPAWRERTEKASRRLSETGAPPIAEADVILCYIVIMRLYWEGVKPTYSEVHCKLKESNCYWELERSFLLYYLALPDLYTLYGNDSVIKCNQANLRMLMSASDTKKKTPTVSKSITVTDIVVTLTTCPTWFRSWVNLKEPINRYPLSVWRDFFRYFRENSSSLFCGKLFKQTRYSLAKIIKETGPPSLRRLRLGEIAHIIQLAIQQGFLCYEANTIQPSWTSLTIASMTACSLEVPPAYSEAAIELSPKCLKLPEDQQKPAITDRSTAVGTSPVQSEAEDDCNACSHLDELKRVLVELLSSLPENKILLSQLRVVLQTRMGLSLVPWTFGYAKLSNLLAEKCSDVCHLVRHGGRHVFIVLGPLDSGDPRGPTAKYVTSADKISLLALLKRQEDCDDDISYGLTCGYMSGGSIIDSEMSRMSGQQVHYDWTLDDYLALSSSLDVYKGVI